MPVPSVQSHFLSAYCMPGLSWVLAKQQSTQGPCPPGMSVLDRQTDRHKQDAK